MRFLVDENLPADVARLLESGGHDVLYLPGTSSRGASDEEVWRMAAREVRIIVTRDLDFPIREAPMPPGVVLVRVPDTFTALQIREVVSSFVASERFRQVQGRVTVVSPGRVRVRELPNA